MKTISSELAAHLAGEVLTLATCWKITRRDGVALGFTDHDQDITVDAQVYYANAGFTPSAISSNAALSVDNLDIEGMLSDTSLTEADIRAGLYDFAEITIFKVNYADLTQGKLQLRRGWLGEVSWSGKHFVAEVRGLTQKLSQTIGDLFSPSCRATLGDAKCKVDMEAYTVTGSVTSVSDRMRFRDSARTEASGVFTSGIVTFTSGLNAGLSMEIKEYAYQAAHGGEFVTVLPLPYEISVGNAYTAIYGCDKTVATCQARFGNIINFRGEPHVPGLDRILETAGTRTP